MLGALGFWGSGVLGYVVFGFLCFWVARSSGFKIAFVVLVW